MLLAAILLPILGGALLPAFGFRAFRARGIYVLGLTLLTSALMAVALLSPAEGQLDLIRFNSYLQLSLRLDGAGKVFAVLVAVLWPATTLYALEYMRDEEKQNLFFTFFMVSYGLTLGVALSANLLTLYVFYEMMSLSTLPLVMHGGSPQSHRAGIKYLYYTLGGAAFAFIGLVYLVYYGGSTAFVMGGLFRAAGSQLVPGLRFGYLLCFLGFSVKAAIFPLHGWLASAAVAPTPVTALLHAVAVVKSGVFAVIRISYYCFGVGVLIGSYAQYIPLALAAFTIVFGCTMALKEKHLKKRLAYSTVSNLSYILFGVLLFTPEGLAAGLLHMVFHAVMKITLFLVVGNYMIKAQLDYVSDINGLSRQMPVCGLLFAVGGLAMTGIPPLLGFISKWALGLAATQLGGLLPMLGLAALLISSILTGIYLLVPAIASYTGRRREDAPAILPTDLPIRMTLGLLGLAMLVMSFWSQPLIDYLARVASGLA